MKKALYFLLILISSTIFIESCGLFGNDHKGSPEISKLGLYVGQLVHSTNYSYLTRVDNPASDYIFDKQTFGIEIIIDEFKWTSQIRTAPISPFSHAYADEPAPAHSKYNPALISIYSDSALVVNDTTYEANTSLTHLFQGFHTYGEWLPVLKLLENFESWEKYDPILLRFKHIPDQPLNQKLRIKVILENGEEFLLDTPIIKTN